MFDKYYDEYKDFPKKIIYKHFKGFIPIWGEDLEAQGNLLLLQAIKIFDETKGVKFSTYAYKHIYFGLNKYLDVDLQGHKRKNVKVNGKWEMKITKPTFVSMDADRDTRKNQTLTLDNFYGVDESNYNNVELKNTLKSIIAELSELAKHQKCYDKCDLILKILIENLDKKHKDIIPLTGVYSTTFYRKLNLIREYMIEKGYKEELFNVR